MRRRLCSVVCILVLVTGVWTGTALARESGRNAAPVRSAPPGVTSAILTDDNIPGLPIPASPFQGTVTRPGDTSDVFSIVLAAGDQVTFVLPDPPGDRDLDLLLYGPDATDIAVDTPVAYLDTGAYPEALGYTASVSGTYYLEVLDYDTTTDGTDDYTVSYSVVRAEASDDIPGVPLPASPITGALDDVDEDDVFSFFLRTGETATFTLTPGNNMAAFDLYLYGPGTESIYDPYLEWPNTSGYPEVITYTATEGGYYYIDVYYVDPATVDNCYQLTWTIDRVPVSTVWRFYNMRNGTHFYTADPDEKARVQSTMGATYSLDGAAYEVNPLANAVTLWRFYKPSTGTHFYTSDPAEKTRVQTTLGHLYQLDGPAYGVASESGLDGLTVWRFYNTRTGTHFYTADADEKARVQATLGYMYQLDGPAYYINP